jgi:hypothetical protein
MRKRFVEKRAHKRIPVSLVVKFSQGSSLHYGITTDISRNGMCINSSVCPSSNSKIKLFVPLKEEEIEIMAQVRRVARTNGFYDTAGVELLDPPEKYLKLLGSDIKTL